MIAHTSYFPFYIGPKFQNVGRRKFEIPFFSVFWYNSVTPWQLSNKNMTNPHLDKLRRDITQIEREIQKDREKVHQKEAELRIKEREFERIQEGIGTGKKEIDKINSEIQSKERKLLEWQKETAEISQSLEKS